MIYFMNTSVRESEDFLFCHWLVCQFTVHTVHCILYMYTQHNVHYVINNIAQCTLHTVHWTQYTEQCTLSINYRFTDLITDSEISHFTATCIQLKHIYMNDHNCRIIPVTAKEISVITAREIWNMNNRICRYNTFHTFRDNTDKISSKTGIVISLTVFTDVSKQSDRYLLFLLWKKTNL